MNEISHIDEKLNMTCFIDFGFAVNKYLKCHRVHLKTDNESQAYLCLADYDQSLPEFGSDQPIAGSVCPYLEQTVWFVYHLLAD